MLSVQLIGLLLTTTAETNNARQVIAEELRTSERVFEKLIQQNSLQLSQGARILSADYAFREAIATMDLKTIISALNNHGTRINAQTMMLIGLDKIIIADTSVPDQKGKAFAFPKLFDMADKQNKTSLIVVSNGKLYQLVLVPVLAPVPIAWVAMGFNIDDQTTKDLQRLTGANVSFLSKQDKNEWKMLASTLPQKIKTLLEKYLNENEETMDHTSLVTLQADDNEYISLISKQTEYGNERVIAVLQQSLKDALEPFQRLQRQLIFFSIIGILISILASVLIARGITHPLKQLAAFARRIAGGDYLDPPVIDREDEIGDLSSAFEHMRESISARESKILDLAYRDGLTKLPNRALFSDRLNQAINASKRRHQQLSVLVMDLDHFKYVNDTLGHHMGDLLLCEVATRLELVIRRQSDTVCRLGGDEFAILLPTDNTEGAQLLARKVSSALETPMMLEGHVIDVRASIGVVTYPDDGEDLQTLLSRADMAMYIAKRNNSGFAVYDPRYDRYSAERLSLMSQLHKAVQENELVLYYQPKIPLQKQSDEIYVEALVRWQHPQRGFIPPIEFIPFAEQTGYIKMITQWVLNRAIEECAEWRRQNVKINIAINISARDLMNSDLPLNFSEMLDKAGCTAEWISLELTESAILEEPEHSLPVLDRLNTLGCKLSIDDYGTGYSSLSYLKKLPLDELKIDRSFVSGIVKDPNDAMIVQSTIDLAHNIGLSVVAEGVETQDILEKLIEMGCDNAQGYLISKPMTSSDLSVWVRESPWIKS